ncbi:MAG: hypothetical protein ACPGXK_06400 [Phycisphaerae bacterium]
MFTPNRGLAATIEFDFDTPSDDRWHYPFNATPGFRTTGSCFGAVGTVDFSNRDGVILIAWDTSAQIPPGQGAENYDLDSIQVTLTAQANDNITPTWPIDTSVDEWFTYDLNGDGLNNADGIERGQPGDTDGESTDTDAGRPIELFGVAFGPTTSEAAWNEFTPYEGDGPPPNIEPRDPYPFVYQDGTSEILRVEEHVDGLYNEAFGVTQFTPTPWSIGVPSGYTPGAQTTPFDVTFNIDLSLSDGDVRGYFQNQLNNGRLIVAVTSLREVVQQGPVSGVPSFYLKEGILLDVGAKAAALKVTTVENPIPAVSTWGVGIMALLLLTAGSIGAQRMPRTA